MQLSRKLIPFAAIVAAWSYQPTTAHARKGPLEGEPIVRKKLDLRKLRLQLEPFVAMSLSQPFVHEGYIGGKLQFDILDWIGVRGTMAWSLVQLDSELLKQINGETLGEGALPGGVLPGGQDPSCTGDACVPNPGPAPVREISERDNPAPLLHDFRAGLTHAQWQGSADVVFTPFVGKLGMFSAIFTEYDVYVFGGVGFVGWQKYYEAGNDDYGFNGQSTAELRGLDAGCIGPMDVTPNEECQLHPVDADEGVKLGASFGGGVHIFMADWASLNLEVQDIITRNNMTGLTATVEVPPVVDRKDRDLVHNVTLQLGVKFYMGFHKKPFRARRSK